MERGWNTPATPPLLISADKRFAVYPGRKVFLPPNFPLLQCSITGNNCLSSKMAVDFGLSDPYSKILFQKHGFLKCFSTFAPAYYPKRLVHDAFIILPVSSFCQLQATRRYSRKAYQFTKSPALWLRQCSPPAVRLNIIVCWKQLAT